jgi:hypothetical protein
MIRQLYAARNAIRMRHSQAIQQIIDINTRNIVVQMSRIVVEKRLFRREGTSKTRCPEIQDGFDCGRSGQPSKPCKSVSKAELKKYIRDKPAKMYLIYVERGVEKKTLW